MADFDLVVTGNLVLADRVVEEGFVAVSDGKIALVGRGARRRPALERSMRAASG